ncbi:baseplate [Escherichia phage vB_EcoM-813R1]|nr:baseplate [Escherichia phage vB_EcoM-813R1]
MGHNNTKGNRKFIKGRYTANAAKGERLVSSEFQLTFAGHEDISVLVRTSQIPEMTREDVEDYGPNGVKFNQHGPIRNSGEIRSSAWRLSKAIFFSSLKIALRRRTMLISRWLRPLNPNLPGLTL